MQEAPVETPGLSTFGWYDALSGMRPMQGDTFGARVRQRRVELGMTLRQMSELTGLAASTLSRVENDRYSPTYDNAVRLTSALAMPLDPVNAPADAAASLARTAGRSSSEVPLSETVRILRTKISRGQRRNLSKIAQRGEFEYAFITKGLLQLRSTDRTSASLAAHTRLRCQMLLARNYYGSAVSDVEILWVSPPESQWGG
jgi:transcriptional regulator with XRE-family HTH domain